MEKSIKGLSDRVLLCILDGFGHNEVDLKNAVLHANTPNIDRIYKTYPYQLLKAGGTSVGLPKGVSGNSEVGHLNLGAGRPVRQDLVRINESIEKNNLIEMPRFKELISFAQKGNKKIHLMGLLSDGSVHSHIDQIKYIIKSLNKIDPELKIFFHAFMDGRDTLRTNGLNYINELNSIGGFVFASMQGRSIGMDRDRRWEKIELGYKTITGQGHSTSKDPVTYIKEEYNNNLYDEFITPMLFDAENKINDGDAVFFLNFRPDRAKQMTLCFNDKDFNHFKRDVIPGYYLCMTPYVYDELPNLPVLFDKEGIPGTLGEYLSINNKKQFRTAETEKFAHVTYFFNGGATKPFKLEERLLIDSPRDVDTYDQKPEMSAPEVLKNLMDKLTDKSYSFYLVNFANPDMVGHTGNFEATIKAIEYMDYCVAELEKKCAEEKVTLLVTADHGNSDQMIYQDGNPHTSHSAADVPFIVIHKDLVKNKLQKNNEIETGALKDVAPTILNILGMDIPKEFTGKSLFN